MKVSIVITAYNVGRFIRESVLSALHQLYADVEVVVVEDCSTDDTREVLRKLEREWPELRVVQNAENRGAGASRRAGIEASSGDYVLLLDGDDFLEDDFVESLARRAIETDADIVSGGITVLHGDGAWDKTCYGDVTTEGVDKVTKFWGERIVFMNNKLIRRSLHEQVPYCTRRFVEDTPTIIPQLYLANKVVYVSNTGYNYRMNEDSLTHKASPFKYCLFRLLCAADLMRFFEKHDREFLKTVPMGMTYARLLAEMRALKPTPEMVAPYREEWVEFTTDMIGRFQV